MLIQDEEVDVDNIAKMCDTLDESEQETIDIMLRLSERYKGEKDSQTSCYKLSQEIEQLEIEYISAQNWAQEVIDSKLSKLSKKPAYQPDERGSGSHTVKIKIPEQSQLQSASQPQTVVMDYFQQSSQFLGMTRAILLMNRVLLDMIFGDS